MPQYKRKLKKGIRWYYKFDIDGKTYFSKAKYLSKNEAAKEERTKIQEIESLNLGQQRNKDITLLEIINHRLDYLKVARTEKYYHENRFYLSKLIRFFGDIPVNKIERGQIQTFLLNESQKQKDQGKDNYSVNSLIRAIKSMFFQGISDFELSINNPCIGIKMFPVNKKIKYIPSDEEIDRVLDKCNSNQRQLIEFVRDTGCRISEALNLRKSDVFDGYIVLYTRKSRSGNRSPRNVKYDTSKINFPNVNEERIFYFWNEAPKFLSEKNGGKWNWHNLRHRYASILSKNNTPIFEIMSLLGHSNLETTQKYLQLLP